MKQYPAVAAVHLIHQVLPVQSGFLHRLPRFRPVFRFSLFPFFPSLPVHTGIWGHIQTKLLPQQPALLCISSFSSTKLPPAHKQPEIPYHPLHITYLYFLCRTESRSHLPVLSFSSRRKYILSSPIRFLAALPH